MAYGHLTVICGPMFSGKSTETLKRILWSKNGEERPTLVFKPSYDSRYSETEIVNHNGLRAQAEAIAAVPEILPTSDTLVFIDEIQFMTEPYFKGDVVEWIKEMLTSGTDVVVAGIDADWKGNPFEVTSKLLGMADEVKKLTADCTVCGRPATKTFKKVAEGSSFELGASESYEARCNFHWKHG